MPKIRIKEEYKKWRNIISETGNSFDRHLVIFVGRQPKAHLFDFRKKDEYEVSEKVAELFSETKMTENDNGVKCVVPGDNQITVHFPVEVVTDVENKASKRG